MKEVAVDFLEPWFCEFVWFILGDSIKIPWFVFLNQVAVVIVCNLVDGKLRLTLCSSSVLGLGVGRRLYYQLWRLKISVGGWEVFLIDKTGMACCTGRLLPSNQPRSCGQLFHV